MGGQLIGCVVIPFVAHVLLFQDGKADDATPSETIAASVQSVAEQSALNDEENKKDSSSSTSSEEEREQENRQLTIVGIIIAVILIFIPLISYLVNR